MIPGTYTLFTRIALFEDASGTLWTDDLWAKDLARHLDYIPDFRICCPVLPKTDDTRADTALPMPRDRVFALAQDRGWGSVIRNLRPNGRVVRRAARASAIVHSSGAGWAFPLSYYLLGLKRRLPFQWIMVIESTFWRAADGARPGLRKQLSQACHRRMIRACLRAADARIFTQDWYRQELYGGEDACHIAPAAWIDADAILPDPPPRAAGPLRVIWPTRMIEDKGVASVLDAIRRYDGPEMDIDMIGSGAREAEVRAFAQGYTGPARVRFLDPVPYGEAFFSLIRAYDLCLIANRTEEQPRIAFDAFSQALPCLASATHGNRSVVSEGETGHLFAPGDGAALADRLRELAADPGALAPLRARALEAARRFTHDGMHRAREAFLKETLNL